MVEKNDMRHVIVERVDQMRRQHNPAGGRFDVHAHKNIFGSYHVKLDEEKMSVQDLWEATAAFNEIVHEGRRVEVYTDNNGNFRTRLVEE